MKKHIQTHDTEKPASNFELNEIKVGKHIFQLEKGDRFMSNSNVFLYEPIGKSNRAKLPFRDWHQHATISVAKHWKDILRADNIEKVENDKSRWSEVYEVKYAYKVEREISKVYFLGLELGYNEKFEFITKEVEIERSTKELYFVTPHIPFTYHSKVEKKLLEKVQRERDRLFVIIDDFEKFEEAKDQLFKDFEQSQKNKVKDAEGFLERRRKELSSFQEFKSKQGY